MDRKEAIELVRENCFPATFGRLKEAMLVLVPELAESEDERNWKAVLGYVKDDALRVWLEKQKERERIIQEREVTDIELDLHEIIAQAMSDKRLADEDVLEQFEREAALSLTWAAEKQFRRDGKLKEQQPVPALDRGDEIILNAICEELKDAPGWVERIKGWYSLAKDAQHPAEWSEEDEKMRKEIVDFIRWAVDRGSITNAQRERSDSWLAYLEKQKEKSEKPIIPEWSEEDEKYLVSILWHVSYSVSNGKQTDCHCDLTDWLKALPERIKSLRPQPRWKPSEDEERLINTSISFLKDFADKGYENAVECIDWLKSKLNGNSGK